ncbi:MAG: sugar ABC transporter permease [Clostridia bacterium]|nr:sugar ABC transporter permease [Clostridia bacterium]
MSQTKKINKNGMNARRRGHIIFYAALMILPCIQFAIFYFGVNISSILRAFQIYEINYSTGILEKFFTGTRGYSFFYNFKMAIDLFSNNVYVLKNTFLIYFIGLFVSQPICIILSYYIFKKKPLSGFFKVMLYLPHVISGLVFSLLFKYITENVYMVVAKDIFGATVQGILVDPNTRLGGVLFFNVWLGLSGSLLLFSGAMSSVDESVLESAQLDGANIIQEFFYIVLPGIWHTYKQLLILGVAGIFGNQMSLMSLFGIHSDITKEMATIGMFFYLKTYYAGTQIVDGVSYGILSAFGLMMTAIIAPATLLIRRLLDKYGWSTK